MTKQKKGKKAVAETAVKQEAVKTETVKAVAVKADPKILLAIHNSSAYKKAPKEKHAELQAKVLENVAKVKCPVFNLITMKKNKQVYASVLGLISHARKESVVGSKNYQIMASFGMYYGKDGTFCTEFFGKHTMYLPYVKENVARLSGWVWKSIEKAKAEDFKNIIAKYALVNKCTQAEVIDSLRKYLGNCKQKKAPIVVATLQEVA